VTFQPISSYQAII
jgi:hypothetical protein